MPELALHHRRMLEVESGINPRLIQQRGYYTITTPEQAIELEFSKSQAAAVSPDHPALVLPLHGIDGFRVGYQMRPDQPRVKDGKPLKYETLPGWSMRIDVFPDDALHKMLADPKIPLWITEGVKKGDCGFERGLCIVDLIGVWNWRGTNEQGGSVELADWEKIALRGRTVYIAFDNDVMLKPAVQKAMKRLAGMLKRRGAAHVHAVVPALANVPEGTKLGLDDFFARGGTQFLLQQCVNPEILAATTIKVNNRNLSDVTVDALEALVSSNIPPAIFVRDGELVRIVTNEREIPKIQSLSQPATREALSRAATWIKVNKTGTDEVFPPKDVVENIHALGNWPGLPPIVAITKAPVLSRSGVISTQPGYCPDSRFYVAAKETWPAWQGTVREAVEFIFTEVIGDFSFAGDADRAHALALMLFPIVRPAFDGPSPLHFIEAPTQGSGKSKLARVCLMCTSGDSISATPGTRDEEEWRKKITSVLLEGRAYVFLDNLTHKLESASLDNVLTSTEWEDRVLQQTKTISLPNFCAWVATANNAELSRDITDRTLSIFIDTGVERPRDREGPRDGQKWRHEDLEGWVSANRATIVSALIKIVAHWVESGRPDFNGPLMGSFEGWRNTIGGIIQCAGVTGFLGNKQVLRDRVDMEHTSWIQFLERWWEHAGEMPCKSGELRDIFEKDDFLAGSLGAGNELARATKLSHELRKRERRPFGQFMIVRTETTSQKTFAYKLQIVPGRAPNPTSNLANPTQTPLIDFEPETPEKGGVCGVSGVSPSRACEAGAREMLPGGSPEMNENPTNPPEAESTWSGEL